MQEKTVHNLHSFFYLFFYLFFLHHARGVAFVFSICFPNPKIINIKTLPKQIPTTLNIYNNILCRNKNMSLIDRAIPATAIGGMIAAAIAIPVTNSFIFG